MKGWLSLLVVGSALAGVLLQVQTAQAAEQWVEVLVTSAGERILVDQNSIQRTDDEVHYWEYRDRRQSIRSTELAGNQPVYGMMIYRSVDCASGATRMERLVLFNQNQQVIRRVNYEESGGVAQLSLGDDADAVRQHVCEPKAE